MTKRITISVLVSISLGIVCLCLVRCQKEPKSESQRPAAKPQPTQRVAKKRLTTSPEWVDLYLPERSSPGFNLSLYRRRQPVLLNMNGELVHSWPGVRTVGRARLTSAGELAVIGVDGAFRVYDWGGELIWDYELEEPDDFPHHDFAAMANGHFLLLVRSESDKIDYLIEISPAGEVIWQWFLRDHIEEHFAGRELHQNDKSHGNSVQVLPTNPWHQAGDQRFRPGNILVSARNLDTVFIVDRVSGEIVWKYSEGLDYQHEAMMVSPGTPNHGEILIFNNGHHYQDGNRQSSIIRLDPTTSEVSWSYAAKGFFSSTGGIQQDLPNGNLLITSSQGGRVFEIEADGSIVWQWTPPYLPMRTIRYSEEHSPQLAALPQGTIAVEPENTTPWIDTDTFVFAFGREIEERLIYGRKRGILPSPQECRRLLVPPKPTLLLEFGLDPSTLAGGADFVVTVMTDDLDESQTVLDEHLSAPSDRAWRRKNVLLDDYELQWIELCLEAKPSDDGVTPIWQNPQIRPRTRHRNRERRFTDGLDDETSPEEEALAKKQLEALGYLN